MGTDIAGWAGESGGWVDVEFDLTSHKSDSAVIRFALASDLAYCVIEDASLKGYFIFLMKLTQFLVILVVIRRIWLHWVLDQKITIG